MKPPTASSPPHPRYRRTGNFTSHPLHPATTRLISSSRLPPQTKPTTLKTGHHLLQVHHQMCTDQLATSRLYRVTVKTRLQIHTHHNLEIHHLRIPTRHRTPTLHNQTTTPLNTKPSLLHQQQPPNLNPNPKPHYSPRTQKQPTPAKNPPTSRSQSPPQPRPQPSTSASPARPPNSKRTS